MSKNLDRDFSLKDWVTKRAANTPEAVQEETVLRVQNSRDIIMSHDPVAKVEPQEEETSVPTAEKEIPQMTARVTNTIASVSPSSLPSSPAQQIQIVRLLRDLGDRLRQSEKEREILWRELDSCRKLLTDIEDKTNNTEKAFLSIEHKMNARTDDTSEQDQEFRKSIEEKIAALETTTGSAVLRIEDAVSENSKLARRLDEATQDRTMLLRKLEEMEETLTQTQDTLKAKALVLLTDQALASRTTLPQTPAWSGNDTLKTQAAPTATDNISSVEKILAESRPWWKKPTGLRMNTGMLTALIVLGVAGGWGASQVDWSALKAKPAETAAIGETPSTKDAVPVDTAAMTASPETPSVASETPVVAPTVPAANEPTAEDQTKLMDDIAKLANQIEPGTSSDNTPTVEDNTSAQAQAQAIEMEKASATAFNDAPLKGSLADRIKADGNLPKVVKDIEKKAFAGEGEAQHDLAAIYTAGHAGVKTNYSKASQWFTEAAHQNIGNAQYNLGVLYHQGLGVQQDTKRAIELYRVAASNNHPEAQYNLGIAHIEGIGADYNPQIAAHYFEKAALGGVIEAAYNLGLIQENGLLGEAQPDEAIFWYTLAANRGNAQAVEALAQVSKQMNLSKEQAGDVFKKIGEQKPDYLKSLEKPVAKPAAPKAAAAQAAPAKPVTTAAAKVEKPVVAAAPAPAPVAAPKYDPVIVAQIQEQLIRLGLFSGSADGTADTQTQEAVKSYQSMNKIKVDGKPSEDVLVHMLASDMQSPASN